MPTEHLINGRWIEGAGPVFSAINPTTGSVNFQSPLAAASDVSRAVESARSAFDSWADTPLVARIDLLHRYADLLKKNKSTLAETISQETGKPRWESAAELDSMVAKIDISIDTYNQRRAPADGLRYKPHGALAVLGPFNMPGHLPNGHIVPALLAGNTIIFKPSEQTPLIARRMAELFVEAGIPRGVFNLIQGGRDTGVSLAQHADLDGLLFTGSLAAGLAINKHFADHPGKILALEMGGNNPIVVHDLNSADDLRAAALITIQSAFITAGQRCSCARRLIVVDFLDADEYVEQLIKLTTKTRIAPFDSSPEPFMGPVISTDAASSIASAYEELVDNGAEPLIPLSSRKPRANFLHPAIVDVTSLDALADVEIFGPLLQLTRVTDLDTAIQLANESRYGLCASLLTSNPADFPRFHRRIRAGLINLNKPTTGASSKFPFGGIGDSGNHRPSGSFATDYCSYPVASMETEKLETPPLLPGLPRV